MYNESFINAIADPFARYVASFSKNQDSLSMWNYYAKGNGSNLGVNIENVIDDNKESSLAIQTAELIYDAELQLKKMRELILSFEEKAARTAFIWERLRTTPMEDEYYDLVYEENESHRGVQH